MAWDGMTSALIGLVALSAMEIVLGIDNIVFLTIVTRRLPADQQPSARRWGLALAMIFRLGLLMTINMLLGMTEPIFTWSSLGISPSWLPESWSEHQRAELMGVSLRDLILLGGGLFLISSSVREIHHAMEPDAHGSGPAKVHASFGRVLAQVVAMDLVFSIDSVITAVGMSDQIWVMVSAVIIAITVMMLFADRIGRFVERHPTVRMLALSFLLLIGVMLVAEGFGTHLDKGYIYFAMAFSLFVEFLNMRMRRPA